MDEGNYQNAGGKSAGAMLLGALIGAAAAILFAPKSGQEMRKDLRQKAKDAKSKMVEKAEQAGDKAVELTEQARDKIKEKADKEHVAGVAGTA